MRATTSFEEVLESCLQELARTSDVESCLRRHPGHAEQLRPLLEAADMIRDQYRAVPHAPGGLAAGRERFLAVAAQERARAASQASDTARTARMEGRRMRLSFARLFPILLVAFLGAAILGGGAVWAAQDSLPGDLLYPVKLAVEEAHLALASAPGGQVDVALGLVEERVEELQALAAAGRAVPEGTVSRMERHIERALTQTAGADDEEMEGLLAQMAERTRTQTQRLEQVLSQAPEQTRGELRRALAVCRAGAEASEAGLQDPGTFRWRYRHREGEPEQEREGEGTPVGTPSATPQGPRGTTAPQATPKRLQGTAEATDTPQGSRGTTTPQTTATGTPAAPTAQRPRATDTPQGTTQGPRATPTSHGPDMTAAPQATPQRPQPTDMPQATPQQGPQPTSMPQATPQQGPQPTSMPQATSQEPQETPGHQGGTPGSGQGEP